MAAGLAALWFGLGNVDDVGLEGERTDLSH